MRARASATAEENSGVDERQEEETKNREADGRGKRHENGESGGWIARGGRERRKCDKSRLVIKGSGSL